MQNYQDPIKNAKITLKPKQAIAWEYLTNPKYAHIRHVGYGGAAGGGKTFLGCVWVIHGAMTYANTRWGVGRSELKNLDSTTFKELREILDHFMGLKKDVDYTYNVKKQTFYFPRTGSEIVAVPLKYDPSDPNCTWLGGWLLTGLYIDESNEVEGEVINIANTRVGRQNNEVWIPASKMTDKEKEENPDWDKDPTRQGYTKVVIPLKTLQTFNPDQNHVYSTFWIPYKNKKQKYDTRFIRAFVYDNYAKDSPYVKNLENMPDGVRKDRLLRGSFEYSTSDAGLFNAEGVAWTTNNKIFDNGIKAMVIDVSASGADIDKTIISYWDGLDCYEIEQFEHDSPEDLIDKIIEELAKRSIPIEHLVIDANGVGNEIARSKRLKGSKSFIAHASPIKKESGEFNMFKKNKNVVRVQMIANYNKLRDQCIWRLAEKVNQHEVTASFEHEGMKDELRQELLLYENCSIGTDDKLKGTKKKDIRVKIGRSPDVSDVFIMRMYLELLDEGIKKPRPLKDRKFKKKRKKIKRQYV